MDFLTKRGALMIGSLSAAAIIIVSFIPLGHLPISDSAYQYLRFVAYVATAAILSFAAKGFKPKVMVAFAMSLAVGCIEFLQIWSPYHHADVYQFLSSVLGAAVGALIAEFAQKIVPIRNQQNSNRLVDGD